MSFAFSVCHSKKKIFLGKTKQILRLFQFADSDSGPARDLRHLLHPGVQDPAETPHLQCQQLYHHGQVTHE